MLPRDMACYIVVFTAVCMFAGDGGARLCENKDTLGEAGGTIINRCCESERDDRRVLELWCLKVHGPGI
jgi:hypothetical protein